jgi:hypothetical protein
VQIMAVGRDGQSAEYRGSAASGDFAYYDVSVKLDSGQDLVVRLRQPPVLPAGSAVRVVNGELEAR